MQTTLRKAVRLTGTGLHSGVPVTLCVHPAPAGHGIVFRRTDLPAAIARIPALWDRVEMRPLHTRLVGEGGAEVATVEHLMAALAGCGIHNARVDLDAAEVPILDGSAAPFVRAFLEAGIAPLPAPVEAIVVTRPVEVQDGPAFARLRPAPVLSIAFSIDFPGTAIGAQALSLTLANGAFLRELADCRTFCRLQDVAAMQAQQLGLGGTLENALVVDGDRILTPGGARRPDEPVRHKMLDALGDLALAGAPLLAAYEGHRAGHALTNRLLRRLFATPGAAERVRLGPEAADSLPGSRLKPADLASVA